MKRIIPAALSLAGTLFLFTPQALAVSAETESLLELLEGKGVLSTHDADLYRQSIEKKGEQKSSASRHHHTVQSLNDRLEKLESAPTEEKELMGGKIRFGGVLEVEATVASTEDSAGVSTDESDVALATAELDVEVEVIEHVNGFMSLLYEEGENDGHVVIDEGIIDLDGGNSLPLSLKAGKMYVPFGNYDSHFVSDPVTVTLGETNDSAIVAGFTNDMLEISTGFFRGAIKETGKEDKINSYVAGAVFTLPENAVSGLALSTGVSYLSNLANSDTMQELVTTAGEVSNIIDGVSCFISIGLEEKFFFEAEYLAAMDDFAIGDLDFVDAENRKPQTWNVELAASVAEGTELALRYEGSNEFGAETPEDQYGVALLYGFRENTSLNIELLHGEFVDDSKSDGATMQLAIEF